MSWDPWIEAFSALPNMEPLAKLIRSDVPMPVDARYKLAELISPREPAILGHRLKCEINPAYKKAGRNIDVERRYREGLEAGLSAKDAAEQAGEPHNVNTYRQVRNIAREETEEKLRLRANRLAVRKMIGRIGGRIDGE
jgi:hypothetical protein